MSRFQVTDRPTSPVNHMTYSFSCLTHTQTQYHTSYREAGVAYTSVTEKYMVGETLMTLIHFYD